MKVRKFLQSVFSSRAKEDSNESQVEVPKFNIELFAKVAADAIIQREVPFDDWKHPETNVPEELTDLFRLFVNAYQLTMLHFLIIKKFGLETEEKFYKILMVALADKTSMETAQTIAELVTNITKCVKRQSVNPFIPKINGEDVEMPLSYGLALELLMFCEGSPYQITRGGDDIDCEGNEFILAACLEHGKKSVINYYDVHYELEINTRDEEELEWSEKPGPWEAHLRRRHNNPLFDIERQTVTSDELNRAIIKDKSQLVSLECDVVNIADKADALTGKGLNGMDTYEIIRREVEDLKSKAAELGSLGKDALEAAIRMELAMLSLLEEKYRHDEELSLGVAKLIALSKEHLGNHMVEPLFCQMNSEYNFIPKDEILASLLTEPITSLTNIILGLGEEGEIMIAENGLNELIRLNDYSNFILDYDEKIHLFQSILTLHSIIY